MKDGKFYTTVLSLLFVSLVLMACGGPTPPAEATVNGVSKIDREKGLAELSVSALETDGNVRSSGQVSEPSADTDQPGFTVEPSVCGDGQITSLGPVTAALTFDATPSLTSDCLICQENDPFDADGNTQRRQGALDFLTRMQSDAQVAVSYFNREVDFVNVQTFTSERDALTKAVQDATSPSAIDNGTNLWDASLKTIELLSATPGENRIAIIFTDGGDNSNASTPEAVEAAALQAGIRMFYIGLGAATNEDAMQNVAGTTNPEGLYISSGDSSELVTAFQGVANSSQASGCIGLGFSPTPPPGQTMTGNLSFNIDGGQFTSKYELTF